jgi:hypothetical protein
VVVVFYLLWRGTRRSLRETALAFLLGGALVAAHRTFPLTGPYSDHAWSYITGTWEPDPPRPAPAPAPRRGP